MFYEGLQLVIGLALIDRQFRESLFIDRARALVNLPLTEQEAAWLLSVRAESLTELAEKLDKMIPEKPYVRHPAMNWDQ